MPAGWSHFILSVVEYACDTTTSPQRRKAHVAPLYSAFDPERDPFDDLEHMHHRYSYLLHHAQRHFDVQSSAEDHLHRSQRVDISIPAQRSLFVQGARRFVCRLLVRHAGFYTGEFSKVLYSRTLLSFTSSGAFFAFVEPRLTHRHLVDFSLVTAPYTAFVGRVRVHICQQSSSKLLETSTFGRRGL